MNEKNNIREIIESVNSVGYALDFFGPWRHLFSSNKDELSQALELELSKCNVKSLHLTDYCSMYIQADTSSEKEKQYIEQAKIFCSFLLEDISKYIENTDDEA